MTRPSGGGGVCVRRHAWRGAAFVVALSWVLAVAGDDTAPSVQVDAQAGPTPAAYKATLDRYCVSCHNAAARARGAVPTALDTLDVAKVAAAPEAWERVVLKLRAGLMPP